MASLRNGVASGAQVVQHLGLAAFLAMEVRYDGSPLAEARNRFPPLRFLCAGTGDRRGQQQ